MEGYQNLAVTFHSQLRDAKTTPNAFKEFLSKSAGYGKEIWRNQVGANFVEELEENRSGEPTRELACENRPRKERIENSTVVYKALERGHEVKKSKYRPTRRSVPIRSKINAENAKIFQNRGYRWIFKISLWEIEKLSNCI